MPAASPRIPDPGPIPRPGPAPRHFVFPAIGLAIAILVAGLFVVSARRGDDLPTHVWIRGAGSPGQVVRDGSPTGTVLSDLVLVSTMSAKDGQVHAISLRRPLQPLRRLRFLLPRFRMYAGGYESTGRVADIQGESWCEFELFDPRFDTWVGGWWPR